MDALPSTQAAIGIIQMGQPGLHGIYKSSRARLKLNLVEDLEFLVDVKTLGLQTGDLQLFMLFMAPRHMPGVRAHARAYTSMP